MRSIIYIAAISLTAAGYIIAQGCADGCTSCGEHAPEKDVKQEVHSGNDHSGHDHSGHAHGPEEAPRISVTKKQVEQLGIKTARAVSGTVRREIRVPGEIKVNSDRVAHVVPRASGIVRTVNRALGDIVKAGDTLAVIESEELAAAKLDFYAKETEVGCCEIRLPRAREIYENVGALIELLEKNAPEAEITKLDNKEMGSYRGKILTAHAALTSARTTYEQEKTLRDKKISSERELINAETAMKQALASFQAIMDTARYETLVGYSEALQERQVIGFDAVAAEKQLRLKGADEKVVDDLRKLVPRADTLKPCKCDNPECAAGKLPNLAEVFGKDSDLALYRLTAPIGGMLIEKHIVMGESIDASTEVFTIADLSSVWADLAVSQENMSAARKGYSASILMPDGTRTDAVLSFVSPVVDPATRTVLARAVLKNSEQSFRPGTFIEAAIRVPTDKETVLVPRDSIQLVNDHPCVFVWDSGEFEVREVVTGVADEKRIEVLKGLNHGEVIAAVNAFHLKAEVIKSAAGDLGDHHGHSH